MRAACAIWHTAEGQLGLLPGPPPGTLPLRLRVKTREYVAEKVSGKYGHRSHQLKAYMRRLDPRHLQDHPADRNQLIAILR